MKPNTQEKITIGYSMNHLHDELVKIREIQSRIMNDDLYEAINHIETAIGILEEIS